MRHICIQYHISMNYILLKLSCNLYAIQNWCYTCIYSCFGKLYVSLSDFERFTMFFRVLMQNIIVSVGVWICWCSFITIGMIRVVCWYVCAAVESDCKVTQKWSEPVSNSKVLDLPKYCSVSCLKHEITETPLGSLVPSLVGELQGNENFTIWHFYFQKVTSLGRCGLNDHQNPSYKLPGF